MLTAEIFWNRIIPALNDGVIMSLSLIIPSAILGLLGGAVVGAVRVFAPAFLRRIADGYVAVFRGVPLLLQLYFLYYALPQWVGVRLSPYQAAMLGFVLCSAAYHSEYIRGALSSIRQGQIRAAHSLGMTTLQGLVHIVIPQAMRRALPGCGNEIIYLIKYSSLAYIITCIELTGEAKAIAARSFRYTEIFMTIGAYYLFLTTVTGWLLAKLERKLSIPGFGNR